jgi:AcrR family transcriptional regulator
MTKSARPADSSPRRAQILDVALDLFAQHGLGHVTTRQIAAAVGISQPSLYAHFPNRDAICVAACVRAMEQLEGELTRMAAPDAPLRTRIGQVCESYVRFGLENEAAYRVAFLGNGAKHGLEGEDEIAEVGLRTFNILCVLVTEAHGGDPHRVAIVAQSAWASLHGLVSLLLCCKGFPWVDPDAFHRAHLAAVVDQILRGAPE